MSDQPAAEGVPPSDPRMCGFRERARVADVAALIAARVGPLGAQRVPLGAVAGRVLAEPVRAGVAVPSFDRAAMDGYAVRGEETFGASSYNPLPFRWVGRARPGRPSEAVVGAGEAVEIATGAALPEGADTVVRVESTRREGPNVWVSEATPPGRHVGRAAEDVAAGSLLFEPGRVLRPQDLGVLSAVGLAAVEVVRRPRVSVIVTGDELVAAGTRPGPFQVADANSVMLAALIARDGGVARVVGPLADDREGIRAAIAAEAAATDTVLVSGGSSAGPEDHAPGLVAELGTLVVHGVALRPASPAGLGFIGPVPIVLLPGNPVSCLCAYDFFAGPIVRRLGGRPSGWPYRKVALPLARKLVSVVGRVDYARVRIVSGEVEPLATSGASILSSTTRADGFVVVPEDLEGYPPGASVGVWLYDQVPEDAPGC
jgi:molybdopterin molybdotransferase